MKKYTTPKAFFVPVEITDIIATSDSVSFYLNFGEDMDEDDVQ